MVVFSYGGLLITPSLTCLEGPAWPGRCIYRQEYLGSVGVWWGRDHDCSGRGEEGRWGPNRNISHGHSTMYMYQEVVESHNLIHVHVAYYQLVQHK